MNSPSLQRAFSKLSTATVADACLRVGLPLRVAAATIRETERRQAEAVKEGRSLREQLRFAEYLEARAKEPSYSFRAHLRTVGGAIEE